MYESIRARPGPEHKNAGFCILRSRRYSREQGGKLEPPATQAIYFV